MKNREAVRMLRWFEEGGNNGDVVISSRVRLARNIKGYNFSYKLEDDDAKKLVKEVQNSLKNVAPVSEFNSYNFDYLDAYQKMGMKERHVISSYLEKQDIAAGFVAPDEDVSIMINEEDHIRIQAFASGMNMDKAYTLADKLDDVVGGVLQYSYDPKFGYLTTLPSNAGTGMRASYMLHLPALAGNDKISGLIPEVGRFGLVLKALEGDNNRALGDIYQLTNLVTLGKSEKEIIDNLDNIAEQIIAQERNLRNQYVTKRKMTALDMVYRSYGVLKYARKVTLSDGELLLSQIRFGLASGLIKADGVDESCIYQLMIGIHPANLLMISNKDMNEEELEEARADFIREHLPSVH
ncbi:MAG: hypothetical protein PUB04_02255 [Clostridia bacterium]|nr:hypothetical protein [Clostridia bacterium]